jgi:uncharacterized membrane protein YeaQ/YmgE (transglycosylase-associated protein family)
MRVLTALVWTWIGIIAWRVYVWIPGAGQRLRLWAFALGLAGAWTGGYLAARMTHGGATTMDWKSVLGSLVGATLQIILFDFIVRAMARRQGGAEDPLHQRTTGEPR